MAKKSNLPKSFYVFLFSFIISSQFARGQTKDYLNTLNSYIAVNEQLAATGQFNQIKKNIANSYKNSKLTSDEKSLAITNTILEASITTNNWCVKDLETIKKVKNAIKNAKIEGKKELALWAELHFAFYQYHCGDYKKSLPFFLEGMRKMEQKEVVFVFNESETYTKLGYFFSYVNDDYKAVEYLKKAIEKTAQNNSKLAQLNFNLGQLYISLGKKDIAQKYFQEALKISNTAGDEITKAKVFGEQALLLVGEKKFDQAIQLLKKDISLSKKNNANRNTLYALIKLEDIYLSLDSLVQASLVMKDILAQKAADFTSFQSFEFDILLLRIKLAAKQGDDFLELSLRKEADNVYEQIKNDESTEALNEMSWKVQNAKFNLAIQQKNNHIQQVQSRNRLLFVSLSFLFIISFLIVLIILLRRKQEKKVFNTRFIQLHQTHTEDKIAFEQSSKSFQELIALKQEQVELLSNEIKQTQKEYAAFQETIASNKDDFAIFFSTYLKTEEAWGEFKKIFRAKYPNYIEQLVAVNPQLTEGNIRMILLFKLGYSDSEIAELVSLTIGAIKKSRQRIQNKLNAEFDTLPLTHFY